MEKNTVKRVTKAMRYEDIIALLTGGEVKNGTDTDKAVEFINNELALLTKKNSSESKKPTAVQEANAQYRDLIMKFLAIQDAPRTCTEIAKGVPELSDFNNQKVAALLKRLCDEQKVVKTTGKGGKSLFAVA